MNNGPMRGVEDDRERSFLIAAYQARWTESSRRLHLALCAHVIVMYVEEFLSRSRFLQGSDRKRGGGERMKRGFWRRGWAMAVLVVSAGSSLGLAAESAIVVTPSRLVDEVAEVSQLASVMIDVRPPAAYAAGHLPGAIRWDLGVETVAAGLPAIRQRLGAAGLGGGERLVIYGDPGDFERLGWAFWVLSWAGASDVRVLDGGFAGWIEARGAIERQASSLPARRFVVSARPEVVITRQELAKSLGQQGLEVLDLRDAVDWTTNGYQAPLRWTVAEFG